jgi:hypothetical protein
MSMPALHRTGLAGRNGGQPSGGLGVAARMETGDDTLTV